MWLAKLGKGMLYSVEQGFVGKDEIAWKANGGGATGESSDTYSTWRRLWRDRLVVGEPTTRYGQLNCRLSSLGLLYSIKVSCSLQIKREQSLSIDFRRCCFWHLLQHDRGPYWKWHMRSWWMDAGYEDWWKKCKRTSNIARFFFNQETDY